MSAAMLQRLGGSEFGVWAIKHLLSPLDRALARGSGGRVTVTGALLGPVLLLTTTGRRTGHSHTTPVFFLRDGDRLILCNVNPGFERTNPWVLNLQATPVARVRIGRSVGTYRARTASAAEIECYWPRLVARWPAYQTFFARSGERTVFVLEPAPGVGGG